MHCLARTAVEGEGLGVLGNLLIRSVGSRIRDPAGLAARACKEEVVCVQKERGASDGQDVADTCERYVLIQFQRERLDLTGIRRETGE